MPIDQPYVGKRTLEDLETNIADAPPGVQLFAGWCQESRYVYLVEWNGQRIPTCWKFLGPMDREAAKEALRISFPKVH